MNQEAEDQAPRSGARMGLLALAVASMMFGAALLLGMFDIWREAPENPWSRILEAPARGVAQLAIPPGISLSALAVVGTVVIATVLAPLPLQRAPDAVTFNPSIARHVGFLRTILTSTGAVSLYLVFGSFIDVMAGTSEEPSGAGQTLSVALVGVLLAWISENRISTSEELLIEAVNDRTRLLARFHSLTGEYRAHNLLRRSLTIRTAVIVAAALLLPIIPVVVAAHLRAEAWMTAGWLLVALDSAMFVVGTAALPGRHGPQTGIAGWIIGISMMAIPILYSLLFAMMLSPLAAMVFGLLEALVFAAFTIGAVSSREHHMPFVADVQTLFRWWARRRWYLQFRRIHTVLGVLAQKVATHRPRTDQLHETTLHG